MIAQILILLYEGGEIIKLKKNFVQYIKKINLRITKVQTYFLIKERETINPMATKTYALMYLIDSKNFKAG